MKQPITKSSLSEAQRRLVELLQNINFGRIERLQVRCGEPVFDPVPQVVESLRMGSPKGPREEATLEDFWLRQPVVDLIQTILELGNGEIASITVMHGLPHVVEIRHHVQP